jgi:16S rRNA (guanine527-N7)-methyltransferase
MTVKLGNLDVSRETYERLETYSALLAKWNPKINLVSKSTTDDIWSRHILDSSQVFDMAPSKAANWVDIGTGGGFPGLVVAILSKELAPNRAVTLIESDQRKCAFLRTVARETECSVTVLADRVEKVVGQKADVLSARALASLDALLGFADLHLSPEGICLFPKGLTWEREVAIAQEAWNFTVDATKSETSDEAVVLRISGIKHV